MRDYIQVTDLIDAHLAALAYLRSGGDSLTCNCGYGHGATVKEVIEVVKRVSGVDFKVNHAPRRARRPGGDRRQGRTGARAARLAPKRDDLDAIVRQALDWERRLHNRLGPPDPA